MASVVKLVGFSRMNAFGERSDFVLNHHHRTPADIEGGIQPHPLRDFAVSVVITIVVIAEIDGFGKTVKV